MFKKLQPIHTNHDQ